MTPVGNLKWNVFDELSGLHSANPAEKAAVIDAVAAGPRIISVEQICFSEALVTAVWGFEGE